MSTVVDTLSSIAEAFMDLINWALSMPPVFPIVLAMMIFFLIIYTKLQPAEVLFSVIILGVVWVAAMPTGFIAAKTVVETPGITPRVKCLISLSQSIDYWINRSEPDTARSCGGKPAGTKDVAVDEEIDNLDSEGKSNLLPGTSDDIALNEANRLKQAGQEREEQVAKSDE